MIQLYRWVNSVMNRSICNRNSIRGSGKNNTDVREPAP